MTLFKFIFILITSVIKVKSDHCLPVQGQICLYNEPYHQCWNQTSRDKADGQKQCIKEAPSKCQNVQWPHQIESVHTSGKCIVLYESLNCKGKGVRVEPGSPSHTNLSEINFGNKISSMKQCLNHCPPKNAFICLYNEVEHKCLNQDFGSTEGQMECFEKAPEKCQSVKWDNQIKSVHTSGKCVTLCQHPGCEGRCEKLAPGTPVHYNLNLLKGFGNVVSSMRACDNRICLYNEKLYQRWNQTKDNSPDGQMECFDSAPRQCQNVRWQDQIESVDTSGKCIVLCEHINCEGRCEVFDRGTGSSGSIHDLGQLGFGNMISSMRTCSFYVNPDQFVKWKTFVLTNIVLVVISMVCTSVVIIGFYYFFKKHNNEDSNFSPCSNQFRFKTVYDTGDGPSYRHMNFDDKSILINEKSKLNLLGFLSKLRFTESTSSV